MQYISTTVAAGATPTTKSSAEVTGWHATLLCDFYPMHDRHAVSVEGIKGAVTPLEGLHVLKRN